MIICHPEIQKEITATIVIGGYNTSVIKCVYQIWGGSEKVLPWSISQNQYLNDQKFWFFEVEQTKNFSVLCTLCMVDSSVDSEIWRPNSVYFAQG